MAPTWLGWELGAVADLVPGCAAAAEIRRQGRAVWLICVYFPPGRAAELLPRLSAACAIRWPEGLAGSSTWMVGDFNVDRLVPSNVGKELLRLAAGLGIRELPVSGDPRRRNIDRVFARTAPMASACLGRRTQWPGSGYTAR